MYGFTWTWRRRYCVISTGSSAVHIFFSGVLIWFNTEWRVVVFPEPVGPTTRKMPYGLVITCISRSRTRSGAISIRGSGLLSARIRKTTSSFPSAVGRVATRNSTLLASVVVNLIFPSCGFLRSEISRSANTLIRAITDLTLTLGILMIFEQVPSIRNLTSASLRFP